LFSIINQAKLTKKLYKHTEQGKSQIFKIEAAREGSIYLKQKREKAILSRQYCGKVK
jgi:hypothetical protein